MEFEIFPKVVERSWNFKQFSCIVFESVVEKSTGSPSLRAIMVCVCHGKLRKYPGKVMDFFNCIPV